jgi:uncharacterized membrane protein YhfC
MLTEADAEAFGLGLAFWENGVLLGGTALVNAVYYYMVLSQGGPLAESTYSLLSTAQPQLFYPFLEALPLVGWGVLERVSSLLVHLSWGYLCVKAASQHRREYLLLALPMGLIDTLVPFVQILTIPVFETIVFILSGGCALAASYATSNKRSRFVRKGRKSRSGA